MNNSPSEFEQARTTMVARQLRSRGISDPRVLQAMQEIPRESFVPQPRQDQAHADRALPIECGQTISQPYIVGLMTQALELSGREHVLEIGTGSGYQTAVLSRLAGDVVSVERYQDLSEQAGQTLAELGCDNVALYVGDGAAGREEFAPYDRITVTAAAAEIPSPLWEQLAEGGILVIPMGDAGEQSLRQIHKVEGQAKSRELCRCRFVPLVSEQES